MTRVSIEEAQSRMSDLIDRVHAGEELIITKDGFPVAVLIAPPENVPKTRRLGTLQGTVTYMASNFDAPLDDFQEYTP